MPSEWIRPFTQNDEGLVGRADPTTTPAGASMNEAEGFEDRHAGRRRRMRQARAPDRFRKRSHGAFLEGLVDAESRTSLLARSLDPFVLPSEKLHPSSGRGDGPFRRPDDAFEEEFQPGFSLPLKTYAIQQTVVHLAMLLEAKAQLEQWFLVQGRNGKRRLTHPQASVC